MSFINFKIYIDFLPSSSSKRRIIGMLIPFAIQHATNGTILPTKGGNFVTIALSPNAVVKAPPVAQRYDVPMMIYLGYKDEELMIYICTVL